MDLKHSCLKIRICNNHIFAQMDSIKLKCLFAKNIEIFQFYNQSFNFTEFIKNIFGNSTENKNQYYVFFTQIAHIFVSAKSINEYFEFFFVEIHINWRHLPKQVHINLNKNIFNPIVQKELKKSQMVSNNHINNCKTFQIARQYPSTNYSIESFHYQMKKIIKNEASCNVLRFLKCLKLKQTIIQLKDQK